MKVVYLLNGTALYGGVKVVFQHAEALRRLGVDAEVVSPEPAPDWYPDASAFYRQIPDFSPEAIGKADIVVATVYYTVPAAAAVEGATVAHLCQCFERLYEPIRDEWPAIDDAYGRDTIKLVVSPHLGELIEGRYGQPWHWIPQPLDTDVFSPLPGEREGADRFRVLIAGRFDLEVKGVERAMRGLTPLRDEVPSLELVRLTQSLDPSEVELWPDAENHVNVPPATVPDLMRSIDLYVNMSSDVEGFGLPTLEAMSCGCPAVLSDIGANRALDPDQRASIRVPFDDLDALADAVRQLRDDSELRQRMGAEGRRIALQHSTERTAKSLVEALGLTTIT